MNTMLFFMLVGTVAAQISTIDLLASAALGGSSASSAVKGAGEKVEGAVSSLVDESKSISSAVVTASSSTPATPAPTPALTQPSPSKPAKVFVQPKQPKDKIMDPRIVMMKGDKTLEPTCKDVADAACADIEKFENCGFCIIDKYPTVGKGCPYTKTMVKKVGSDKKMGSEYDVVLVPECECKGSIILEAKSCPTCEHALEELMACADPMKKAVEGAIEITEKCLKEVGVTVEYLVKCGYIKVEDNKKEKDPATKKYVVKGEEKEENHKYVVVLKDPKPTHPAVMVPAPTSTPVTATATATASASVSN